MSNDGNDDDVCIACNIALKNGDKFYFDVDGGYLHAACAGPEREGYVGSDGEPLKDGDPIPGPKTWVDPTTAPTLLDLIEEYALAKSILTLKAERGDMVDYGNTMRRSSELWATIADRLIGRSEEIERLQSHMKGIGE